MENKVKAIKRNLGSKPNQNLSQKLPKKSANSLCGKTATIIKKNWFEILIISIFSISGMVLFGLFFVTNPYYIFLIKPKLLAVNIIIYIIICLIFALNIVSLIQQKHNNLLKEIEPENNEAEKIKINKVEVKKIKKLKRKINRFYPYVSTFTMLFVLLSFCVFNNLALCAILLAFQVVITFVQFYNKEYLKNNRVVFIIKMVLETIVFVNFYSIFLLN